MDYLVVRQGYISSWIFDVPISGIYSFLSQILALVKLFHTNTPVWRLVQID
jgi:hypothetical protein